MPKKLSSIISILVFLLLVFQLCFGKQAPSAPFDPLDRVAYASWDGSNYKVVSFPETLTAIQIDRYGRDLHPKTSIKSDLPSDLTRELPVDVYKKLPDGFLYVDHESRHLVTQDGIQPMDETMGARLSLTPDNKTLIYANPEKDILYVKTDGNVTQYSMDGLVDLQCISNDLAWLCLLDQPNHKNTSLFFDLNQGKVIDQREGLHEITMWGDYVVLRPSLYEGIPDDKLTCFHIKTHEWKELPVTDILQQTSIRFSGNGKYASALGEDTVTVYNTKDFSVRATAPLPQNCGMDENVYYQTVSNDGKIVLLMYLNQQDGSYDFTLLPVTAK